MQWEDLVVETKNFEFGRESRIKEVLSIRNFIERNIIFNSCLNI